MMALILNPAEVPEVITKAEDFTDWLLGELEAASLVTGNLYLSHSEIVALGEAWRHITSKEEQ